MVDASSKTGSTRCGGTLGENGRQNSFRPESLNNVDENHVGQMVPGDIIVLGSSPALRKYVASIFYAIVSCPACGLPGLITAQQYSGVLPVICPSDYCPCNFRIHERSELVYLPVN